MDQFCFVKGLQESSGFFIRIFLLSQLSTVLFQGFHPCMHAMSMDHGPILLRQGLARIFGILHTHFFVVAVVHCALSGFSSLHACHVYGSWTNFASSRACKNLRDSSYAFFCCRSCPLCSFRVFIPACMPCLWIMDQFCFVKGLQESSGFFIHIFLLSQLSTVLFQGFHPCMHAMSMTFQECGLYVCSLLFAIKIKVPE